MPEAPRKPCQVPGCRHLVDRGYCEAHARLLGGDVRRASAARRGYGRRWQSASKAFLLNNPVCVECQRRGRTTLATVVDHIHPHRGDQNLFWDRNNWQPLCKSCHDRKSARESGFGRPATVRGGGASLGASRVDRAGPSAQTAAI